MDKGVPIAQLLADFYFSYELEFWIILLSLIPVQFFFIS
jgi:hypothetical protein